eukprot:Em0009g1200a
MASRFVQPLKSIFGGIQFAASKLAGGDSYNVEEVEKDPPATVTTMEPKASSSNEDIRTDGAESEVEEAPSLRGTLLKWTNYLQGWQDRYFVLGDGILTYYRSEGDAHCGCRGSIHLDKAKILLHEFDELRFDVRTQDCSYFLRTTTVEEKAEWVEAIEANKKFLLDKGFDEPLDVMRRQGSILSLSALSQTSTTSMKSVHNVQLKLAEIVTYRDILCRQVDVLQAFYEAANEIQANRSMGQSHSSSPEVASISSGISSARSIDEHPEEAEESSVKASSSSASLPRSMVPTSPLPARLTPKGHRRTESDPFAFQHHARPMQYHRMPIDVANIDLRGEAITFKATTAAIVASLSHCVDLISKREEYWQKKMEKETERRHKAEVAAHAAMNGPRVRAFEYAGPDFEEGPHSALNEDEFFDALEMAYQFGESEHQGVAKSVQQTTQPADKQAEVKEGLGGPEAQQQPTEAPAENAEQTPPTPSSPLPETIKIKHQPHSGVTHRLTSLVDEKVQQYARYIFEPVNTNWSLVHEDLDMKVYRRELEEGGVVVDPLKASYTVRGITAREVISYFFDKETRLEWEGTLESVKVVEKLSEDTLIFHQLHKRMWPSTQRETLFCSHLCTLTDCPRPEYTVGHTWMVCNFSMDHPDVPPSSKLIRAMLQIGMVCQTIADRPVEPGKEIELRRDEISCQMVYAANVNPGGWAPPSVVRTIAKRELSKFLKKFSQTVLRSTVSSPLTL